MENENQHNNKRKLTKHDRQRIAETLIQILSNTRKSSRDLIQKTAKVYNIHRRTVTRIWQTAKQQLQIGDVVNVDSKMKGKVGRKRQEIDLSKISEIPLHRRTNVRSLTKALGVPKSTTHRLLQKGEIRSHSSAIEPLLTKDNTDKRLELCLGKHQPTNTNNNPCFQDFYNHKQIEEKWFFMTKTSQKYYLHPLEDEPIRTCKSKRFITKIIFLAAIMRPRFGPTGEVVFDGKIGIFPFTVIEAARRKSKNREAGVLETKPIATITKEVMKQCLLQEVIPAIKQKWLADEKKTIYIQQDNAKPHINPTNTSFIDATTTNGFDIRLTCQPPNSPDLNVLDLGFFRAIQALQYEKAPKSVVDLVEVVKTSLRQLQPSTLNNVWLSLQYCMHEILKVKGTNAYKLPHVGKQRMINEGTLPLSISIDASTVQMAIHHLNEESGE